MIEFLRSLFPILNSTLVTTEAGKLTKPVRASLHLNSTVVTTEGLQKALLHCQNCYLNSTVATTEELIFL